MVYGRSMSFSTRRPSLQASAHARGMSLLEMLLVIALVAMVGLLTASAFSRGLPGMQLRSAGKDIASQLRFTRAHAIARGVPQRFTITPHAHQWNAPGGRNGSIPERLQVQFEGAAQLQGSDGSGSIEFHPDGGSSGGRIVLGYGEARWRIDVSWLTGQVVAGPERTP